MSFLLHEKSSFAWSFKMWKWLFATEINLTWFFYFFFRVHSPIRSIKLTPYKTFMEKMELKILYRSFVYLVQESKNYNFYARKIPVAQRKSSCRTDGANLPLEKFSFRWFNIKGFYTSFRISIMLFSTVLIETDPIFLSKK